MNVNALSNIANPYIQSLTNAAMSALNSLQPRIRAVGTSGTPAIPQDGSPQLSPFAQLMSTLQQLQQNNPSQYSQVTQQIAANLQSASQTALANGNTTQAQQLNTLSTDFQSASTSGQLPNVSDLAEAMGGHHHHHHHYSQSNSSSSDSNGSSTSSPSTTTSGSTATQSLSQLFGAFANDAAQSASLNPMNIIFNTLSSAGITMAN
ncbi:MAG: hypothetical protein ACLQU1_28665 [Bryobacteraceae bacterium]